MLLKFLAVIFLLFSLLSCKKQINDNLVIADNIEIDKENLNYEDVKYTLIAPLLFSSISLQDIKDSTPHNILADEIIALPGGKSIEIMLRKGVRFHDGREMTANDVGLSFSKMGETDKYINEKYGAFKVEILDRLKLRVTSGKPLSDLISVLSDIYVFSKDLAGTGPYRFSKWLDNGVELVANDDYFEGAPKLKKVVYRYEPDERKRVNMLLKGEADLLAWLSPEMAGFLREDDKFYVKEWPAGFYSAIFLNNESSLFSDKVLRKAISMAIDRDKLIKKVLKGGGLKTLTPLPPQLLHTENSTDYRPREAIRLLKDAGWRDADGDGILEKSGRELKFRLYYDINVEEFKKMADLISQDLFEIGIGVEAIPANMDESTGRSFEGGNYDAILFAKSFGDSVNIVVWGSSSHKNLSRFRNMEMDNLLNGLKSAADIEQKKEIYGRMKRIFKEEAPAVFLYNPVIYTAASKRFKGAEDFVGYVYSIYKIKDWSINNEQ